MRTLRHTLLPLVLCASFVIASPLPQKTQNFWTRVLKLLGVTATPANQKGDEDPTSDGDIWLSRVAPKREWALKQGNFRSPIFLPSSQTILALSGDKVVKFDFAINDTEVTATEPATVWTKPGLLKLISVQSDALDQVLVLTDLDNDNCPGVGVLNLTDGNISPLPHNNNSNEDRDLISYLSRSEREYDDGTKLEIRKSKKTRNGAQVDSADVFLQLPTKNFVNVSQCRPGMLCGQPAISIDRKFVVFVGK